MKWPLLLHECLDQTASRLPHKDFLICGTDHWTYQKTAEHVDALARGLIHHGLAPQDRVSVFLDTSPETVVSLYAVSRAGGIVVNLNSSLKAEKLRYILQNSDAKILITHVSKARIVRQALHEMADPPFVIWITPSGKIPEPLQVIGPCASWNALVQEFFGQSRANHLPAIIDQDLAALIYTSGSTGRPKGIMQPHYKMLGVARSIIQYLDKNEDDVILNPLSLAFGYGLYQVVMAAMVGATVILEKSFVYLHETLSKIPKHGVTGLPFVPSILCMILHLRDIEQYDFSSLRYATNAGAALPVPYLRKFRSLWPHVRLYPMYGLTECVRVSYLDPEQVDAYPDSVGREIPNCKTMLLDADGRHVPPGRVGELVVTGTHVMPGYWKDPELTARVFRQGPLPGQTYLHTGDLFTKNEQGFLFFVGRKDDMIKCRGERVSPLEVENILLQMEAVAEAAVIGVTDEISGQAVKAFVVPKKGVALTEQEVLKFGMENMENFMAPKYAVIMEALPKTPNGKIDKQELKKTGSDPGEKVHESGQANLV